MIILAAMIVSVALIGAAWMNAVWFAEIVKALTSQNSPANLTPMSEKHDTWEKRVERVLKLSLDVQRDILEKISGGDTGRRPGVFGFIIGQPKPKSKNMPLELKITNEQQIKVTLAPKTDTGKPATLDGSPAWTTISGNSQVVVSEDGLSATLVSADDPGDTEIMVKADADLGEGVEEISDIIKLSVVGATAKNLGLTAGTPEAKPTV